MNKKILVYSFLALVLISVLAGLAYTANNSDELESQDLSEVENPGVYTKYSEDLLPRDNTQKTLLFFSASWCPTCGALKRDLDRNLDKIPNDMVILDIDYDTQTELKKKYDVRVQHTILQIDKDGKVLKDLSGTLRLEDLVKGIV